MEQVLIRLATMSFQAGIAVCAVILVRFFLRCIKAPKQYAYVLWLIPFLRMVMPVSPKSMFSLVPAGRVSAIPDAVHLSSPDAAPVSGGAAPVLWMAGAGESAHPTGLFAYSADWAAILGIVWIAGILVFVLYSFFSFRKLQKNLCCSVALGEHVYYADHIDTPFVLGCFRPKIYLPSYLKEEEASYVLKHERTHIRRHDPLIKTAAYLTACVHWFNPLAWTAFLFLGKDMEMSCDEAVLRELGEESRSAYAQVLLNLSSAKRHFAGMPLAFGEGSTKERIVNIMKYRKPLVVTAAISAVVLAAAAVGFLTDPKSQETDPDMAGKYERETIENEPTASEDPLAASGIVLDYADSKTVIFHGAALYVYSLDDARITNYVDLWTIDCAPAETGNPCQVSVLNGGSVVYLHAAHSLDMYVYDVGADRMEKQLFDTNLYHEDLFEGLLKSRLCIQMDPTIYQSADCVKVENDGEPYYIYLDSGSGLLEDLRIVTDRSGTAEYQYAFQEGNY